MEVCLSVSVLPGPVLGSLTLQSLTKLTEKLLKKLVTAV